MHSKLKTLHCCALDGTDYFFRTPTPFDLPAMRAVLTRRRVRRPTQAEFRVAALAGIKALGELADDAAEADRQQGVMEEWHRLMAPIVEDEIDEPDQELRAAEFERLVGEREEAQVALVSDVSAIEANLGRHWQPYADLLADMKFWTEVTAIEVVRTLLVKIGDQVQPLDENEALRFDAFQAIPLDHLPALEAFARALLMPTETERKN
jgi:hypothetical protein